MINIDEFELQNWFFHNLLRHPQKDFRLVNSHTSEAKTCEYFRLMSRPPFATSRLIWEEPDIEPIKITPERTNIAKFVVTDITGMNELFNEMVIRGDSSAPENPDDRAVGPATFDGLNKIITKNPLHVWEETLDLTGLEYTTNDDGQGVTAQWLDVINQIMEHLHELSPPPTFILGNDTLISALSELGRRADMYTMTQNDLGMKFARIGGISLIPMGKRYAKNEQIIPISLSNRKTRENPEQKPGETFETQAYVGSFGRYAIMGLQLQDVSSSGYEKADNEMHIGMAVNSVHACGMFTHICLPKSLIDLTQYLDKKT